MSTQDILSPRQCRAARGLLGWSQDQLADAANVARATIANFETGKTQPVGNNLSAIRAAFEQWWQAHSARISALSGQMDNAASLVALRNDLLASFSQSLEAIGLLDPFQVRGIVAGFWYQTKYDFLTLMARGAKGVADAWRTSIVTALEDKASKESPLEHKLVKFLMSDFVEAITELEAVVDDLREIVALVEKEEGVEK